MIIHSSDSHDIVVIKRGESLNDAMNEYLSQRPLKSAWLNGLGGAMNVTLGFYDLDIRDYRWKTYDQALEIVSLTGNLALLDGKPFWHVHGSFSGADYGVVGGHVKELIAGLTLELMITPHDEQLVRAFDDEIGLNLIQPH